MIGHHAQINSSPLLEVVGGKINEPTLFLQNDNCALRTN